MLPAPVSVRYRHVLQRFTVLSLLALVLSPPVLAMGELVATLPQQVRKLAVNPVNREIYATTATSLLVIDPDSFTIASEVVTGGSPQGLAVSPDGSQVYVATSSMASLAVIDVASRTALTPIPLPYVPYDVAAGNGNRLYVTPGSTGNYQDLVQVNTTDKTYATYPNNGLFLYYNAMLQISPDRNTLFIGNQGLSPGTLYKLDVSGASPSLTSQTSSLGSNGEDLAIDASGTYIYYAMGGGNRVLGYDVARIRTADLLPDGAVLTGPYPREAAPHKFGVLLFTVNESGYIGLWDMSTQTVVGQIDTGSGEALELVPDASGRYLLAAFDTELRVYDVSLEPVGDVARARMGSAVAMADMNKDGTRDYIVGTPLADVSTMVNGKTVVLKDAGNIRVYSGTTGSLLRTFNGTAAKQNFGVAFAVVSDQNADGVPDLVVGQPLADVASEANGKAITLKDAGQVALYSGNNGALLSVVVNGDVAGAMLGSSVAVGDLDNDATPDLVAGAPGVDVATLVVDKTVKLKDAGAVFVYDGLSNTLRYSRSGSQSGEKFGASVATDSTHRLYAGSSGFDVTTSVNSKPVKLANAGRVQIFAGANGTDEALFSVEGERKADAFGTAIAMVGTDLDQDGNQDWIVSAPLYDAAALVSGKPVTMKDAGRVSLYSGLAATPMARVDGENALDNFGVALYAVDDLDDDSMADLLVTSPGADTSVLVDGVESALKDVGKLELLQGSGLVVP